MTEDILARGKKRITDLIAWIIVLIIWNAMIVGALFCCSQEMTKILLISSIIFTLFGNGTFVWQLMNFCGKEIYMTKDNIIIIKSGKIKKIIPNSEVKISTVNKSLNFIGDKNNKREVVPFTDINDIKYILYELGFDCTTKGSLKKDVIITIIVLIIIALFKYGEYRYNIAEIRKDASSYMGYMQNSIKRKWKPEGLAKGSVIVEYKISKKGEISDIKIIKSSKDAALDSSALQAVEKIKLPALPDSITTDFVITNFTFNH